jgi:hypothetical protein
LTNDGVIAILETIENRRGRKSRQDAVGTPLAFGKKSLHSSYEEKYENIPLQYQIVMR